MEIFSIGSNEALVISTFFLVIVTFALVIVTWIYAGHTKLMANVMAKDYELKVRPLFTIEPVSLAPRNGFDYEWNIFIKNVGVSKIYLQNAKCESHFLLFEHTAKIYENNELREVLPGEQTNFHIRAKNVDIGGATPGSTGTLFELRFYFEYAGIEYRFVNREVVLLTTQQ